jgi:PAS domain S-box-containing protein
MAMEVTGAGQAQASSGGGATATATTSSVADRHNNNNDDDNDDDDKKRSADDADLDNNDNNDNDHNIHDDDNDNVGNLTDKQKLERRERNREHAKRSRLRKKFLLESLQEQIHGLQEQMDKLKQVLKDEVPLKAETLIQTICGNRDKYTPLPMPSGFGPVKTLMEPDFRLMTALSGSQQNFAISDPTLPDNPIVYVSQGFLDLTGYTLDQVLGRNCRFLQGPGTDQSAVDVIRKGINEGLDTSVCLLNYKADGTPFWNQFFVAALRDAENNVVNYVGVQCEVSKAVVEKHMSDKNNKNKQQRGTT